MVSVSEQSEDGTWTEIAPEKIERGRIAGNVAKIRRIADANVESLSRRAELTLAAAKADPLNADAVRRAVEAKADLEGYRRAAAELLGMVEIACES